MTGKLASILLAVLLTVSPAESKSLEKGFIPLFNGRDLSGWQAVQGWEVRDGVLRTSGRNAEDLFTTQEFGNFILRLDYMLSNVGNSGVFVHFGPDRKWSDGFEVQMLAPWTPYRDDLHCTGSMYGLVAVTNRPDETTGVWHSMEIVFDRRYMVVSVDGSPASWAHMDQVPAMRRKNMVGVIGFQGNHSDSTQWVQLRNIRIKNLDQAPEYVLQGFGLKNPELRERTCWAAVEIGLPVAPGLIGIMAAGDSVAAPAARQALFAVAAKLSAPARACAERDSLAALLRGQADKEEKEEVRGYLTWLAGMLGGGK